MGPLEHDAGRAASNIVAGRSASILFAAGHSVVARSPKPDVAPLRVDHDELDEQPLPDDTLKKKTTQEPVPPNSDLHVPREDKRPDSTRSLIERVSKLKIPSHGGDSFSHPPTQEKPDDTKKPLMPTLARLSDRDERNGRKDPECGSGYKAPKFDDHGITTTMVKGVKSYLGIDNLQEAWTGKDEDGHKLSTWQRIKSGAAGLFDAGTSIPGVGTGLKVLGKGLKFGKNALKLGGKTKTASKIFSRLDDAKDVKRLLDGGRRSFGKVADTTGNALKKSKVVKSKTTETIGGKFTKTTEIRPGKGPGQSRAEYVSTRTPRAR